MRNIDADIGRMGFKRFLYAFGAASVCFYLVNAARGGPTVTNTYAVNIAPTSLTQSFSGSLPTPVTGYYIGNDFFFTAGITSRISLGSIPAGAKLFGNGTVFVENDVLTYSGVKPDIFYSSTLGGVVLGNDLNTSLGPRYTPINTGPIQAAIDAAAASFDIRATISSDWVHLPTSSPYGVQGTTQLKYQLVVPNATSYHAIPVSDAQLTSYDHGVNYDVQQNPLYLGSSEGFSLATDLRAKSAMEFDLSTIPAGQHITKATLSVANYAPYFEDGAHIDGITLMGFGGSGTAGLSALTATTQIGSSGQMTRTQNYDVALNPAYVERLLGTGHTLGLLGTSVSGIGIEYSVGGTASILGHAPELLLEFGDTPAAGHEMTFSPRADGVVTFGSGQSPSLDTGNPSILLRPGRPDGSESRGLMQFDARALPANEHVASVSLDLNTSLLTLGGAAEFKVYAHIGNGALSPTEASDLGLLVGDSGPLTGLGPISIHLDRAKIEQLLGQSGFLSFVLVGTGDGAQIGLGSAESDPDAIPTLTIQTVPEPNAIALGGIAVFVLVIYGGFRKRAERAESLA